MFNQNDLIAETGKLQKFALRLTRNKSDADDLVQSTCLRALEKMEYFEEGTNLFRWTSRIMYNLFVSGYRRRTKFETQYDPETFINAQAIEATQDIILELAEVNKAMAELKADYREILILVSVQGLRYEEVSKTLNIPIGTVRSRLSRAREQLTAIMDRPSVPTEAAKVLFKDKAVNVNTPFIPGYIAARALQRKAA